MGAVINAPNGFIGDIFWAGVNGANLFKISGGGALTVAGGITNGNFSISNTGNSLTVGGSFCVSNASDAGPVIYAAGYLGWVASGVVGINNPTPVLRLYKDADNTLAQRNGTTPQVHRIYNTFTGATNFERAKQEWASNVFLFGTEKGSGGGTARDMELQTDGVTRVTLKGSGAIILSGLPTTNPGVTGQLWNDGGTLKIA